MSCYVWVCVCQSMLMHSAAFRATPTFDIVWQCSNVSRVARKTMLLRVQSRASGFLQFLNSLKSTREEPRPPNSTENERYPLTLNTHHHSSLLNSSPSLLFSTLSTPRSLFSSAFPIPPLSGVHSTNRTGQISTARHVRRSFVTSVRCGQKR